MGLIELSIALFVIGTATVALSVGTGLTKGRRLLKRVTDVQPPRIDPKWISGGTIEAPASQSESKLNSWTLKGVAVVTLLLVINATILAAAVLFAIGAFTAGSGFGVFLSSFVVGVVAIVLLVITAKQGVSAVSGWFNSKKRSAHHKKTGFQAAKTAVLLYATNGLFFATFWLFVAGLARMFI